MNFIWDLVDPVELTNYVRAFEIEMNRADAAFMLDRYLPNRTTNELEFSVRRGGMNDVDVAVYRAWDTPAPMTDRPGTSRIAGELGPISRQIPLGEEERLRRDSLLRNTNDPIVDGIYADAERMLRAVAARIELARGDLIDDGRVNINENGLQLVADWGRSAGASPTAAIQWDLPATAVPLSNLLDWVEDYVDLNGFEPAEVLIARAMFGRLALTDEIRNYAASGGTVPTRLNAEAVAAVFAAEGLPPFRIYDGQFRVNGVRTRVLNENKVYLMPPASASFGETRFGVTAEAIVMQSRGMITETMAPGIVALVHANDHPVQTFTLATAVALPITPNPDYVFDCLVNT